MDFDSNHLILAGIALIVIILIRTLIAASKEINSSDKFPSSSNDKKDKKNGERSPWDEKWVNAFRNCGFRYFFIVFITIPLKIYHFTLFNSGVSIVVGILALLWFFYSVSSWVTAGFRRRSLKKS